MELLKMMKEDSRQDAKTPSEKCNSQTNDLPSRLCGFARYYFSIMPVILLFTSCISLIQRGGEFLEGGADRQIAVYRGEGFVVRELRAKEGPDGAEGAEFLEITGRQWPGLAFRGSMPDSNGRVHLTEARFLSSHVHGWNEFNLELLGNAFFRVTNAGEVIFYIDGEVERVQINSGRILLRSNLLVGTEALIPLRNRRERIIALNEWMHEWNKNGPLFAGQKEFENFWKPHLFPELVSRRKRPQEFRNENAEWARKDSVRWNLTYTENIFPEHLREYRNSGAMLRDWEEALPWIFMEYSFNIIVSSFMEE